MVTFTIICKKKNHIDVIRQVLITNLGDELELTVITNKESLENHLHYEIPQFVLFDLDDPEIGAKSIIEEIVGDPMLFNIRILGISENSAEKAPVVPGIFAVMTPTQLHSLLPHLIRILSSNQQLVLQTRFIRELGRAGSLTIENNPLLLEGYAELVSNFLYSHNLIDMQIKYGLKFGLIEMLMNAVEHGNCGIGYQEKSEWLEQGKDIVQLIQEKCKDPQISAKRVILKYEISEKVSHFTIQDEGNGFDISTLPSSNDIIGIMELHGRGIFMTRNYVKSLRYNDKGNEVTLSIDHLENTDRNIPEGFLNSEMLQLEPGRIVFRENDKSNTLYYIIGGEFEVLINDKVVATLNNTNIFLGEMAFLLGNRRTATVRAKTHGQLVAINAKEWMAAVQKYPYYGIFLSRLLAQKLDAQSHYKI